MLYIAIQATLDRMEEGREYLLTKEIYETLRAENLARGWFWDDTNWSRENLGITKIGPNLRILGKTIEIPAGPDFAFAFTLSLSFAFTLALAFTLAFAFPLALALALTDGHLEGLPEISGDLEAVRPNMRAGKEVHGPVQAVVRPGFLAISGLSEDAVAQILAIAERDGLANK